MEPKWLKKTIEKSEVFLIDFGILGDHFGNRMRSKINENSDLKFESRRGSASVTFSVRRGPYKHQKGAQRGRGQKWAIPRGGGSLSISDRVDNRETKPELRNQRVGAKGRRRASAVAD